MNRLPRPTAAAPLWTRWEPGPAAESEGPVLVSVTDFVLHRALDMPGARRAGLRLRKGWFAMEGAVGLWLWAHPFRRRIGSVSVWKSETDLHRFVRLPAHVAIMRHYRSRGALRSQSWRAETFAQNDVIRRAQGFLAGRPFIDEPPDEGECV